MTTPSPQPLALPFAEFLKTWWYMPYTVWQDSFRRFYSPQIFFGCNIEDVDDEYNVLKQVGSYGKQIGQMQKVLDILVTDLDGKDLSPPQRVAVDEYRDLRAGVVAALADSRGPRAADLSPGYVERLTEALKDKRAANPKEYDQLMTMLRALVERLESEQAPPPLATL